MTLAPPTRTMGVVDRLAVGTDVIEIGRVRRAVERYGARFLERVYTDLERALYAARPHELAARFAAKEAVMKALGTGVRGVAWREIEVLPDRRGKPRVHLHGRARARAEAIGLAALDVSLTHSGELAIAVAVGARAGRPEPEDDLPAWRRRLEQYLRERGGL